MSESLSFFKLSLKKKKTIKDYLEFKTGISKSNVIISSKIKKNKTLFINCHAALHFTHLKAEPQRQPEAAHRQSLHSTGPPVLSFHNNGSKTKGRRRRLSTKQVKRSQK